MPCGELRHDAARLMQENSMKLLEMTLVPHKTRSALSYQFLSALERENYAHRNLQHTIKVLSCPKLPSRFGREHHFVISISFSSISFQNCITCFGDLLVRPYVLA